MTNDVPITLDQMMRWRTDHARRQPTPWHPAHCGPCDTTWPCPVVRLIALVTERNEHVEWLQEQRAEAVAAIGRLTGRLTVLGDICKAADRLSPDGRTGYVTTSVIRVAGGIA